MLNGFNTNFPEIKHLSLLVGSSYAALCFILFNITYLFLIMSVISLFHFNQSILNISLSVLIFLIFQNMLRHLCGTESQFLSIFLDFYQIIFQINMNLSTSTLIKRVRLRQFSFISRSLKRSCG